MGFYPDPGGDGRWEREGVAEWEGFDEEGFARREADGDGDGYEYEDEEDDEEGRREAGGRGRRGSAAQRTPLLTDIEAPSVTEALREEEVDVGVGEGGRPKSGMRSAFMNMANSIM